MYKLKLYIEGQEVEMFKDENVILNSSVQNVKDISKVYTDYSQSFTIPASPINNTIFSHWYNVDLVGGFDARAKVTATIEINHITFKKGKVRLNSVTHKNGIPINYKITFFGLLVGLVDLFKDDTLSDLDFSSLNHEYSYTNVKTGMESGLSSGSIIYPLISPLKRWYYSSDMTDDTNDDTTEPPIVNIAYEAATNKGIKWNELKPAILVSDVLDKIESTYGLTFSADFINTTPFDDLYLWCSRDKGYLENSSLDNESLIDWTVKTSGTDDYIDLTTDEWNNTAYREVPLNAPDISYNVRWKYEITITPAVGFESINYNIKAINKFATVGLLGGVIGTRTLTGYHDAIAINRNEAFNIGFYVSAEDAFEFTATADIVKYFYEEGATPGVYSEGLETCSYSAPLRALTSELNVASFLPNIKVIDFFQGIIKMFNLAIIPSTETSLYIDTLDNWYAGGDVYNITNYIIRDDYNIERLKIPSSINFKFKEPKTLLALNHLETFDEVYGDLLYSDEDVDLDGGTLNIELPFEQMKYERILDENDSSYTNIQIGYCVDKDEDPELIEAHLFYGLSQDVSSKPFALLDDSGIPASIALAFMPFHGNIETNPDYSTLWGADLNEWDSSSINKSLYGTYYSDYVLDMYNSKRRVFNFEAQLPVSLLNNIKLNDILIIKRRSYIINDMTINLTTGNVKFELLNYIGDPVDYTFPIITLDNGYVDYGDYVDDGYLYNYWIY